MQAAAADGPRHVLGEGKGLFRIPNISPCCRPPSPHTRGLEHVGPVAIIHDSKNHASPNYPLYCFIIHPALAAPGPGLLLRFLLAGSRPPARVALGARSESPRPPIVSANNMLHFSCAFRNRILNSRCLFWLVFYCEPEAE